MNESTNTTFINRKIKAKGYYALKIQTIMNNGVPDCWYSGPTDDLWVEFKYKNKLPTKRNTPIYIGLTELQEKCLKDRFNEGRNISLIIGSPEGYIIITNPERFKKPVYKSDLTLTRDEVIQWIILTID